MTLPEKYFLTRQASVDMCQSLSSEDYVPQPVDFVSPPKWNLGHTSWFFEELILKPYLPNYKVYHKKFAYLFNSYYQSLGDRTKRGNRGDISRPTKNKVYEYRNYVDNHMQKLFVKGELNKDITELITIGINHEQQHQELFYTDLKYTFSLNPLHPKYSDKIICEKGTAGNANFIGFNEGVYEIGHAGDEFAYDNEGPRHKVYIHNFEIADKLVSNAEYLEFVEAGGYQQADFWHDEAWHWLDDKQITHPMYWVKRHNEWHQYTLAGLKTLKADVPVTHLSYYEAYAYAQWKGKRLPTEFEWEIAADSINWGDRWEWTESAYLPYPGYKKLPGALGEYNGKFMVNQKVLRGLSVVTPKGHERKTYRNFFHPHIGYQYNGIRLAK